MTVVDSTKVPTQNMRDFLAWVNYKVSPLQLDRMVERAAFQTEAHLKEATPKHWFGQVRNGWQVDAPELQTRVIHNDRRASNGVQIVQFLEEGTANDGTGFIYPRVAKRLYVPLTRRAAGGWRQSLKYGIDYILKKFVRGQKGQHFIAAERELAKQRLLNGFQEIVREILARGRQ